MYRRFDQISLVFISTEKNVHEGRIVGHDSYIQKQAGIRKFQSF
jgi:hypothetical protein